MGVKVRGVKNREKCVGLKLIYKILFISYKLLYLIGASNSTSIRAIIVEFTSKVSKKIFSFRGIISLIGVFSSGKSLVYTWFLGPNSGLNKPTL